jgi:hypothetical protein
MAQQQPVSSLKVGLQWQWIIIGVVLGGLLTGLSVFFVATVFHRLLIPGLMACLSFTLTGVIVGYNSPGITIKEAAIAGLLLAILTVLAMSFLPMPFPEPLTTVEMIVGIVLGFLLALLGGWVGEHLQGETHASKTTAGFQWLWVLVGVVIGFMLNNFFLAFLSPLFKADVVKNAGYLITIIAFWGLSFIATGIIVGYKSPGVTIMESAVAGVLMVGLNLLVVYLGLQAQPEILYIVIAMVVGFALALLGGWTGERLQKSQQM